MWHPWPVQGANPSIHPEGLRRIRELSAQGTATVRPP
jgi:hypothetical protein